MSKSFLYLTYAVLLILPQLGWSATPEEEELQKTIALFRQSCDCGDADNIGCKEPFSTRTLFHRNQRTRSPEYTKELRTDAQAAAVYQAQIWGDTILEGDYVAAGRTRVDRVQGIYRDQELVAYRILYSEKAWDVSQCNYDPNNKRESLKTCTQGRISETTFTSKDLKTYEVDDQDYAEFEEGAVLD